MECFSGFWSRRLREGDLSAPWIFGGVHSTNLPPTTPKELFSIEESYFQQIISDNMENDLREILREKAEKHRDYYNSLIGTDITDSISSPSDQTMVVPVPIAVSDAPVTTELPEPSSTGSTTTKPRQRRRGVYEIEGMLPEPTEFKSVKLLRENYIAMLEKTSKQLSRVSESRDENSEISDEKPEILEKSELLVPPSSGYSSSTASGASDDEREKNWRKIERRSGSSDSAVQSDEEGPIQSNWGEKKEEIFPIDGYQPRSPYSPRCSVDHSNVPSKTIIEAHYVPLPLDRKFSVDVISETNSDTFDESRRHSCFSEGAEDQPRYRYWRTPSVVVSDYSDDIMGLTLEDIEYIRSRRDNSISPDSSLHSSCSNLNFCGSTISGLDGDYVLCQPYRKSSNCSTCSTLSDEEESPVGDTLLQPHKNREPSGWRKLRNIVQWTPFFQTYKKQRYPWVQLAGHQGNFKAGPDQGTILKKLCAKEEKCFKILMKDVLRPYVPEYKGLVTSDDGECSYIQLQDLLGDFVSPCVMDCKIGVRTYLEEELAKAKEKPKLRKDMYDKMCQIDQTAPTDEEHKLKGVTKPRYMVWRETISSTATLGFRIEGIRSADGTSTKDFKTTKTKDQVMAAFEKFTDGFPHAIPKYIQRLKAIKATLETSQFFNSHEVIGSSLLFVHDRFNANVWLIDFAKTIVLPENVKITHSSKWKVGNHEDGYLIGVNNLIKIYMNMLEQQPVTVSPPLALQDPPEVAQDSVEKT
ncbi:uncharacterized protein LOC114334761 isoform X2 [Diabrotica virgifera virgifera]|uniref:Kinase n=1 Tax=Diabrotica virgifera virgifera TaxID=50390 RepID=A0A6P7FW80_DIAVI|nr:uncharacterized protein LOC114334761 isoform X2 [Diabrotica virgifera virgifera]XP_028140676.1 uncharacterized protein LOC114334761 isoform X2 [Diabrotica virgifera virgifera]